MSYPTAYAISGYQDSPGLVIFQDFFCLTVKSPNSTLLLTFFPL